MDYVFQARVDSICTASSAGSGRAGALLVFHRHTINAKSAEMDGNATVTPERLSYCSILSNFTLSMFGLSLFALNGLVLFCAVMSDDFLLRKSSCQGGENVV